MPELTSRGMCSICVLAHRMLQYPKKYGEEVYGRDVERFFGKDGVSLLSQGGDPTGPLALFCTDLAI